MNKRILSDCLRTARANLSSHVEYSNYPVYSFIVQDNKVLGWGTNASGDVDGPLASMYNARVAHNNFRSKIHAEYRCYNRVKGLLQRDKTFEIVNIRLNRRYETRLAAPCSCCTKFLNSLNCSHAYFSTDIGWAKQVFL